MAASEGGGGEGWTEGEPLALAARPKRGKEGMVEVKRLRGLMEVMKFAAALRGSSVGLLVVLVMGCWERVLGAALATVLELKPTRLVLLVVLLAAERVLSALRSRLGRRPARSSRGRLFVVLVVGFGLVDSPRGSSGEERPERVMLGGYSSSGVAEGGVETSLRASSRVLGMMGLLGTWSFSLPKRELRLFSSVPLMLS